MSDKYTIRNCELICNGECPNSKTGYCQDCTDCVMKQIVELCKHDIEQWKAVLNGNILEGCVSNKILKLLDIQEVE